MKVVSIIFFLAIAFNVQAKIYYVATDGDDTNIGTEKYPWKTIQKAANILIPNDTVFIKVGVYNERVVIQNSGSINGNIVFTNYKNDKVVIDGNGIKWWNWNGLFDISEKSYIVVDGINIKNALSYGGIWIDKSSYITIKNCYTYNTFSSGISCWDSEFINIENCEVELACNDGEQECISIVHSNNCNIFGNNVHNNGPGTEGGEGIDVKQGSHDVNVYKNTVHHINNRIGIYTDAWDTYTYNVNIYQNKVHHCYDSGIAIASEKGGKLENIKIYNNISYYNKWGGIEIGSWSDVNFEGLMPIENIKIINNTCYKNGQFADGWGYGIVVDNPDAKDIIIRNNICSENSAQLSIQRIKSCSIDHNLIYGNNTASGTIYGKDSVVDNPLFIDGDLYDFHLKENSPSINKASSNYAPSTDFDNIERPYGDNFDIGAYEYSNLIAVKECINISDNSFIDIYPNPVINNLNILINTDKYHKYKMQIFNINGKVLQIINVSNIKKDLITIDRKYLASGLYILKITMDNNINYNKKIIVK